MNTLSIRCRRRLAGVHPRLVAVVERAVALCPLQIMVIEGVRTLQRQQLLYDQGRTTPGKIVTWTLESKHRAQADGYGHAVDVAPVINGAIPWTDTSAFDRVARAMLAAAAELGTPLRWGADWDRDGKPRERGETDSPHFELHLP